MPVSWSTALVDVPMTPTLLEYLKTFLGIDPSDATQDDALERALATSGGMIERFLDLIVAKREVTEYYRDHFDTVVLHNLPVEAPVTVTLNGTDQIDVYSWYKDAGGLAHLTRSGQPNDIPSDWRQFDQVDVTYTAGFDPIPADLSYGIVAFAANCFKMDGTGSTPSGSTGDLKQFQLYDVGSVSYDTGTPVESSLYLQNGLIPPDIAEMLLPYQRLSA